MKLFLALIVALCAHSALAGPVQSPKFADLGNKVDQKLTELKDQLQETVDKVNTNVQELEKRGHDLLAEKLEQVRSKFQQLVDALEKKLNPSTVEHYGLFEDVGKAVEERAVDAKSKLSEVSKILGEKAAELEVKLREQLVKILNQADAQVDRVMVVAEEEQEKALEAADKFDEKVLQVKEQLHRMLDTLHEKYLELRENSRNWAAKFGEKRRNMLNKVKDMIRRVKDRLTSKPAATTEVPATRSKRELSDTINQDLTKKVDRLTSRIHALEQKAQNMNGLMLERITRKINALRSLLESLKAAIKGGSNAEIEAVNYDIAETMNEVLAKEVGEIKVRIVKLQERFNDASGKVKEALGNKLEALRNLIQRLEDRLRVPIVYGNFGAQVDSEVETVSGHFGAELSELKQKVLDVIEDLKAKSHELQEHSKQRALELLNQVKQSVDNIFPSGSKREKRSLSNFGKKLDDRLSKLREALKFESLGRLTETQLANLKQALTNAVTKAVEVSKHVKDATVEAAQGHVDVAKKFVDQMLDAIRKTDLKNE